MSDSDSVPLAVIRSAIGPSFDGTLIEALGCGIYTLLVFQTVWKLYYKGGKLRYSTALVVLWISTFVSCTADWVAARETFVSNNSSPLAIFIELSSFSLTYGYVLGIIAVTISDAIIIWRCHILWQNKVILSVLVLLLLTANGFAIYVDLFMFANIEAMSELIQALAVLSSFITTFSATFLIAFKIVLVTRRTHRRHHYTKIINILVQSAAMLSVVLLGFSILSLIDYVRPFDLSTATGNFCYQLENYLGFAKLPIAGIAPTLIAFRVTEELSQEANSTNKSAPLSRLTFRRSAYPTDILSNATSTTISVECT